MSTEPALILDNLGKKYLIRHEDDPGYGTFRDLLINGTRSIVKHFSRKKNENASGVEQFWALRNISLTIEQGDAVGVIGRNGAGKSTLLKLLSRITAPSEGSIRYRGKVASLLEVGTGFHPELSGRENIFLNGAILGMSKQEIRKKFDEIVDFAEIEQFLDTPVKRYSSGMYVRLAFAVAAHLEPDILIVDEVLAVGDAAFQRKCLGKMRDVTGKKDRTVLFVSHNMQSVQALCNKAVFLNAGQMIDYGDSQKVIATYFSQANAAQSERVWSEAEAPGDLGVSIRAVRVIGEQDGTNLFGSGDSLSVEIEFDAKSIPKNFCCGFDLMNGDGLTVFRTLSTDATEDLWPQIKLGTNRWRCRIPSGLLNAGVYYISLRVQIPFVQWIANIDAVMQFEIAITHGDSPVWTQMQGASRPGLLAPIYLWTAVSEP